MVQGYLFLYYFQACTDSSIHIKLLDPVLKRTYALSLRVPCEPKDFNVSTTDSLGFPYGPLWEVVIYSKSSVAVSQQGLALESAT